MRQFGGALVFAGSVAGEAVPSPIDQRRRLRVEYQHPRLASMHTEDCSISHEVHNVDRSICIHMYFVHTVHMCERQLTAQIKSQPHAAQNRIAMKG